MRLPRSLLLLPVFASWALLAHASDTVNYDDPNLAFTSAYVGDSATDVASNSKDIKGSIAEQTVILSAATAQAITPRQPKSSAR